MMTTLGGGSFQQGLAVRCGGALGSSGYFREYGKATRFDHTYRPGASVTHDGRHWVQSGFRADWGEAASGVTLQGDAYRVESADRGSVTGIPVGRAQLSGENVLMRWTRRLGDRSSIQVQSDIDHARREECVLFQQDSTLADTEMQHTLTTGIHRIVWGAGYRYGRDDIVDGFLVGFRPTRVVSSTGRTRTSAMRYGSATDR